MEVEHVEVEGATTGSAGSLDAFLQTGRTGRRNAVPDIADEKVAVSTADLPCSMEKLSCSDSRDDAVASTSGSNQANQSVPSVQTDSQKPS